TPTISFIPFFFNDTPPIYIYTLSLHDALPICISCGVRAFDRSLHSITSRRFRRESATRTSKSPTFLSPVVPGILLTRLWTSRPEIGRAHVELQSPYDLVCRLLLEKKKKKYTII